jgi:hypothetical protein
MHSVCSKFQSSQTLSSADIIWSHFETTDSCNCDCQAFFRNGILGGRLKIKNILQLQVFIKVSCLKGF